MLSRRDAVASPILKKPCDRRQSDSKTVPLNELLQISNPAKK